ncbi:MAG: peptide deformylase [Candidatus Harrisonbacteria bacterium CG10_big_fil_rev_8_21_14_0_10_38_8]|uniref:Peptide deformylase n=1 Tax=Candidatus Harrisonbacteria bacterium CG10_big_fil_rev_8_21_14_0_10_38_8 TaxID=1974582 RepID=A0A2M6WKB8_9BACT|nr:MAG: peptide deformylase [Candidatus Harrisonbacteria bacterium CG10_big_fil_rev_8_21_14_0_10_38_8]
MKLYTVNNPDELKLLKSKLREFDFKSLTNREIRDLIKKMRVLMKKENGVGLASNQVGLDFQVFIAQESGKFYAIFNPKITKTFGKKVKMEEGCLSVPGKYGFVDRYEKIVIEGLTPQGKKLKIKAWGLLAQIFQHETDHLNGELYINKAKEVFDFEQ